MLTDLANEVISENFTIMQFDWADLYLFYEFDIVDNIIIWDCLKSDLTHVFFKISIFGDILEV